MPQLARDRVAYSWTAHPHARCGDGAHRSGTTIVCKALARSGAFVFLTAADVVAFHERSGAPDGRSTLAALARKGETRKIDAVAVSENLAEEYGFLLPGRRLTPETAPVVASVYRDLAGEEPRGARYLLRNPWDFPSAPRILELFSDATFATPSRRSTRSFRPPERCSRSRPSTTRSSIRATGACSGAR